METKPDVELLPVPVLQLTQLLDLSQSQIVQQRSCPSCSNRRQVPSKHPHVAALFSGSGSTLVWSQRSQRLLASAPWWSWSPEGRDGSLRLRS